MDDKTGLVHQMPFVCDRPGFPAILEKVYFGTSHARIYLAADCVGVNCPTGMSALMRKKLLDDAGGIKEFGCYLAEDYFFAKSITNAGWKISISSQVAWQNSGVCDIPAFQARISRYLSPMLHAHILFKLLY
jgi:ceramide glucosyltransferase